MDKWTACECAYKNGYERGKKDAAKRLSSTVVDEHNQKIFNDGSDELFACRVCGRSVTLDDSVSKRGKRLVCMACFYNLENLLGLNSCELLNRLHRED